MPTYEKVEYIVPDDRVIGGTTAGQIRAAAQCESGGVILKTLFPAVFETKPEDKSVEVDHTFMHVAMTPRISGPYAEKAIFLSSMYNWELKRESAGLLCLIPTRK